MLTNEHIADNIMIVSKKKKYLSPGRCYQHRPGWKHSQTSNTTAARVQHIDISSISIL